MPKRKVSTSGIIYKRCYFDWGGRCAYCGMGLPRIKRLGKVQATVDHFIPLSKGGQNARSNRVLACFDCNMAKDNIDPRESNQWLDVAKRLAEIAATPNISHKRLKPLVAELVATTWWAGVW